MAERPSGEYVAGTLVAAGLVVVGAWLPWASKYPSVRTDAGLPYMSAGYEGSFAVPLFGGLLAVVAVGLAWYRRQLADALLVVAAVPALVVGGLGFEYVWFQDDNLTVEPGLFLVLAGGLFLAVLGLGSLAGRISWRALGTGQESPAK